MMIKSICVLCPFFFLFSSYLFLLCVCVCFDTRRELEMLLYFLLFFFRFFFFFVLDYNSNKKIISRRKTNSRKRYEIDGSFDVCDHRILYIFSKILRWILYIWMNTVDGFPSTFNRWLHATKKKKLRMKDVLLILTSRSC